MSIGNIKQVFKTFITFYDDKKLPPAFFATTEVSQSLRREKSQFVRVPDKKGRNAINY